MYNRGSLKSKRFRDFDGALSDLNLAIKIYPKYENAYIVRGIVKTSLDDYNGAISDYTKAIDLNADNALAYYNRAAVKAKYLRNRKTACADFDIAASLGHSGAKKISNNLDCYEFR